MISRRKQCRICKKKLDRFSNYESQILGKQTTRDMGEQMLGEMEDIEVKGELPQLLLLLYIPIILVSSKKREEIKIKDEQKNKIRIARLHLLALC